MTCSFSKGLFKASLFYAIKSNGFCLCSPIKASFVE